MMAESTMSNPMCFTQAPESSDNLCDQYLAQRERERNNKRTAKWFLFQRAKPTLDREGERGSTDIQNLSWSTGLADIVVLQRNALHVYSGADSIPFQTLLRSPSSLPSHDLICKAAISVVVAFALVLLHCLQPAHDLQYRLDTATSSVSSHF
jgi:hypothetical protein